MQEPRSRYPFSSYPDGWYCLSTSVDLAAGDIVPLQRFGRELVLFRTEAGAPALLEAHCPHLGAHIGHGGSVVGESVACPFHGWRFATDGRCVEVPYATRGGVPSARLAGWTVEECAGLVFVWHSEAGNEPSFPLREVPEWDSDEWLGYEHRSWKIRMHAQELPENVPDRAHFRFVHGMPDVPESDAWTEGAVYHQKTSLRTESGEEYVFARQECWGLGLIWLRAAGSYETFFLTAQTPIDEEYCHVTQYMLVHNPEGHEQVSAEQSAWLDSVFAQTDADIPIWENKVYRSKPALVPDDGPLLLLREWAQQFYP